MTINNRLAQYAAGIFFLLACCVQLTPYYSDAHQAPSRIKVSAGTTNESSSTGHQIRKISLEISLFTHLF
ncbi:hypothetical protein [Pedobacter sp. B4-66]|uniref:hypothetical protein n=1 Tax=Pedobacter sp. B4-66 TaxID=2817280 RepID=UPI001BD91687|nr:hypothetical protein [Pedobacter sp. B4-66]